MLPWYSALPLLGVSTPMLDWMLQEEANGWDRKHRGGGQAQGGPWGASPGLVRAPATPGCPATWSHGPMSPAHLHSCSCMPLSPWALPSQACSPQEVRAVGSGASRGGALRGDQEGGCPGDPLLWLCLVLHRSWGPRGLCLCPSGLGGRGCIHLSHGQAIPGAPRGCPVGLCMSDPRGRCPVHR